MQNEKNAIICVMIPLIIAIVAAVGGFAALHYAADWGLTWSIVFGLGIFFAIQITVGLRFRRVLAAITAQVQQIMVEGQRRVQQKMQRWQLRPPGSVKAAQREIFDDMRISVDAALKVSEQLRRYRLWVPLLERQIATMQLQLVWMVRDFDRADKLLPKAIMADPMLSAIKLARMQMLNAPIEKISEVYKRSVRRLRYNQNTLPAACYSWILVHRQDLDGAFKVLTEALKNSDDETLRKNHTALMNNRPLQFSNSGLGDKWYSLFLEEPKVRMQHQRAVYR